VSISIRNTDKVRPVLMHVDKVCDTIETICERVRAKFGIKPEAKISRLLLCPTGEIIDDVELIERNDKIEVELVKSVQ
jgi:hypothetical protein